jgi:hypothetical protein
MASADADAAYLEWLACSGVDLKSVSLGHFAVGGRGVVALKPLLRGDVVVSVPDSLVILADNSVAARALAQAGLVGHVRACCALCNSHARREALIYHSLPPAGCESAR